MDGPRRRVEAATRPLSSEHWHHGPPEELDNPASAPQTSIWPSILYILRQFWELPQTVFLLTLGFIVPEARDWITTLGMGKTFTPATDIGSLEGKVVLVTGGMETHFSSATRAV